MDTEQKKKEFEGFIISDDDCRFVLPKMRSKLGDVAIDHMLEVIWQFIEQALKEVQEVERERAISTAIKIHKNNVSKFAEDRLEVLCRVLRNGWEKGKYEPKL